MTSRLATSPPRAYAGRLMDLDRLEALALSDDRSAALAGLLPGTVEHDYWRGVHLQHQGRLGEVDTILAAWQRRHGGTDESHARLARRQLLLRAGQNLPAVADTLRFEAGVQLDDEAEAVAAAQRYPTRLDPAVLDEATLVRDALAHSDDLTYLTDWALPDLTTVSLDATRRRHLLQRLTRANFSGLVALIAADLDEKTSRGFGTLAVHNRLTLTQLDELAHLRPALRRTPTWVTAVLTRLRPPAHIDWQHDLAARRPYLEALWAFVEPLVAGFNNLKAQVLYHLLDLDRRQNRLDRARLLRYLALPRQVHYARHERLRDVPADQQVTPGSDAAQASGLPAIADDEPLVREHLEFFLRSEDASEFAELLRADWLEELLASTRLLAGDPDADRWAALLGPARLAALQNRVDLELTVRNPTRISADAPVTLEVDVKNVPQLVIKTFRVDPVAYFLARRAEVDTAIDLDGLVASDEQVLRTTSPAIQRQRLQIALPGCDRPGTYVIELIGNGKSSRALIRKGSLHHTTRVGAAGPTIRVLDEHGHAVDDAAIWLAGREHRPRADGAISIPFSTAPTRTPMLLVHGDVAQMETLHHPGEHYQLTAGLHLERESLVPGKTARLLIRPLLTVAGWPAPLALLDDPHVDIAVTDRAGTPSSKTRPVTLHDDAETVVELHVPEDAALISVTLRGQVRVTSTQQTLDLTDSCSAAVGQIHQSDRTEALHLAATATGHVLHLLGKTGEPRGGRAVALSFKPAAITYELGATLETDERGRIELGPLTNIEHLTAVLPSGAQQRWPLGPEADLPRALHLLAGVPFVLPRPPGLPVTGNNLALSELRGGAVARDLTAHITHEARALVLRDLEPGEYLLQCRGAPDLRICVAPATAAVHAGWALTGPSVIELSPPLPRLADLTLGDEHLHIRVADARPATRVHVLATRFLPDRALPRSLRRPPRTPLTSAAAPVLSHYVSGREIGDEYRYVLDRRGQPRRPGVLLDKPSLLLNPWALRTTSTGVQQARGGGSYGASPARPPAPPASAGSARMRGEPEADDSSADTSVDFLASAAVVLANLVPDANGAIVIPRAELGAAQSVRILVVDPALTSTTDLPLPETSPPSRDLRLRLALAHDQHFSEERRIDGAPAGTKLVIEDLRAGKLELVDTTARAHQLLLSLGVDSTLRDFAFITQWHTLDETTRRARYSKYACHELHLFLRFRDPEFFARVVRPALAHKRHKTFVDRWLLAEDLSAYREPWAFGRLNALERVLLARALPPVTESVARLLGDEVDLIPPDPERDARLVDTLLGAAALEGGGGGGAVSGSAAPLLDMLLSESAAPATEAEQSPRARSKKREQANDDDTGDTFAAPKLAHRVMAVAASRRAPAPGGIDLDGAASRADLAERSQAAPLFRGADKTQEWAESDWWHVRAAEADAGRIPANRFWRDLARHDPASGPFLSPHLGECITSFADAMGALAVLDLPFVAGAHEVQVDDTRLALTCASPALAARTHIVQLTEAASHSQILVGQSYFRADDRWAWDGAEQREKYVEGELLVGVVYQCQVVVTNPTSREQKLAVLLQIPRGAMPVASGFYTRTMHLRLMAYGTQSLEYAFYFPRPGSAAHFPAHVSVAGALVAFAAPKILDVVLAPSQVDATSWAHVSQHGSTDDVLAFLARANLGRIDLDKIAWRMRDREAFTRVLAHLEARLVYSDRLWAYALAHADRPRVAEWLRHHDELVRPAGPVLQGAVVELDPVERVWYEHLEYAPLINARAHQLGATRQIVNDALAAQYRGFLDVVAHRDVPTADDLLAAAHYLLALDRVDDGLAALTRVDRGALHTELQYDYLAAYAACLRGDLAHARAAITPWLAHPVDRWRHRFVALAAMLDEAEGKGKAAAVDADSRDLRMDEQAARQPAIDLTVAHGSVLVQHHNVARCHLRFYKMDIELLFSRQPFVQGDVERFSWIEPGAALTVELTGDGRTAVEIPATMRGANLVIEAVGPGLRRSITHYAHDLATQLVPQYGQVRVLHASTQTPLPATYVKVYARQAGGQVNFYKDGYTDLRGRFDYATLSTDDLDRVERFAILIASDEAGATVLEAPPPPR